MRGANRSLLKTPRNGRRHVFAYAEQGLAESALLNYLTLSEPSVPLGIITSIENRKPSTCSVNNWQNPFFLAPSIAVEWLLQNRISSKSRFQ
jgi:hypothetical protein